MIKKEIGPFHEIMQTRLLFDSETNDETKISIQFARTSASKGWQLTLPVDTAEVGIYVSYIHCIASYIRDIIIPA